MALCLPVKKYHRGTETQRFFTLVIARNNVTKQSRKNQTTEGTEFTESLKNRLRDFASSCEKIPLRHRDTEIFYSRHCEEQRDEAIQSVWITGILLAQKPAMTNKENPCLSVTSVV